MMMILRCSGDQLYSLVIGRFYTRKPSHQDFFPQPWATSPLSSLLLFERTSALLSASLYFKLSVREIFNALMVSHAV